MIKCREQGLEKWVQNGGQGSLGDRRELWGPAGRSELWQGVGVRDKLQLLLLCPVGSLRAPP